LRPKTTPKGAAARTCHSSPWNSTTYRQGVGLLHLFSLLLD
jgi:hypothetical protein